MERHRQADDLVAGIEVAERDAFRYPPTLAGHPARLKRSSSDNTAWAGHLQEMDELLGVTALALSTHEGQQAFQLRGIEVVEIAGVIDPGADDETVDQACEDMCVLGR